jgi:NRPS condensation-like uncharacterized protein
LGAETKAHHPACRALAGRSVDLRELKIRQIAVKLTVDTSLPQPPQGEAVRVRTFPLLLTPFEDYMSWDDRPEYPMAFVIRLEFEGAIDRDSLEAALPLALARHPLLQANIKPAKRNENCWVAAESPAIPIQWGDLQTPITPTEGEQIDIRRNVGVRIWVRSDGVQSSLITQFHHACCDGIGAYQFLSDWLWFYADKLGQPVENPLPPADLKQLRNRQKTCFDLEKYRNAAGKIQWSVKELLTYSLRNMLLMAKPRESKRKRTSQEFAGDFPGVCSFDFDKDQYKKLRLIGERRGQSINELLLERLLVCLNEWNRLQGDERQGRFCIMMPMDLREAETRLTSAANLVTYALIRRDRKDCVESEALVDSLRQEMLQTKHTRHKTHFMNAMAILTRYPRWLKRTVSGRGCMATAILSNTGDPSKRFTTAFPREKGLVRAGNLLLKGIDGVPPMRTGTRLTIAVLTYGRILRLSIRCDPHWFTSDQTREFLNLYANVIQRLK